MELLPLEIRHEILSSIPIKTIVPYRNVCRSWTNLIDDIIKRKKINEITFGMLANMINTNCDNYLFFLYESLTNKLQNKICRVYAYKNDVEKVEYCINNGALWTRKSLCYALIGFNRFNYVNDPLIISPLINKYGLLDLEQEQIKSIIKCNTKHDNNYIVTHRNFDMVFSRYVSDYAHHADWLLRHRNNFINCLPFNNILSTLIKIAIRNDDFEILNKVSSGGHIFECCDFMEAIKSNKPEILKLLISMNGETTVIYADLLYESAKLDRDEIFKLLYHEASKQIQPIVNHTIIFTHLLNNGNIELLKWFHTITQFSENFSLLHIAIAKKNSEIVKWIRNDLKYDLGLFLMMHSLGPNKLTYLCEAVVFDHIDNLEFVLNKYPELSIFYSIYAVHNGDVKLLKWFIQNGYQINYFGCYYHAKNTDVMDYLSSINPIDFTHIEIEHLLYHVILSGKLKKLIWLITHTNIKKIAKFNVPITITYKKYLIDGKTISIPKSNQETIEYYNHFMNS